MGKKAKPKNKLPQPIRDALVKLYVSGGGKISRIEDSTVHSLYDNGLLRSHNNLCWAWATYSLSPAGIEAASEIAGF